MKLTRSLLVIALSFHLSFIYFLTLAIPSVSAQDSKIALRRGYRTGYSDGYMSGYRDVTENVAKDYSRHKDYKNANRAYSREYGKESEYQYGYRKGFQNGYDTGFEKRSFDATIPTDLKFHSIVETKTPVKLNKNDVKIARDNEKLQKPPVIKTKIGVKRSTTSGEETIIIPAETELVIELNNEIDTRRVLEGDEFTANIVSPHEINGAVIEGKIAKNRRPGRFKRGAELSLSFDRIKLSDTRWSNFNAIVTEVLPIRGDNVKGVDNEGQVEGQRSYKSSFAKAGVSAGAGTIIGAIVGGPVGAAIGAGIGAAFGVGTAFARRGKYIKLSEKQQLRIKTAYETQIR